MAERRMFSKAIIDSDAFLDMPASTQMLYFHLCMRADDEGFVNNPKRIQRMCGANDDDYKILCAKSFIIEFESGVIVIKHWRIHNYIQKDRFHKTNYQDERSLLDVKKNGAYTISENLVDTSCIQDGYKMDTEVRLGKVSLGKVSLEEDIHPSGDAQETSEPPKKVKKQKEEEPKHHFGECGLVMLTDKEYDHLANKYGVEMRNKAIAFLDLYIADKGYKSKSHNYAIQRWVIDAVKERESKTNKTTSGSAYIDAIANRVSKVDDYVMNEPTGLRF